MRKVLSQTQSERIRRMIPFESSPDLKKLKIKTYMVIIYHFNDKMTDLSRFTQLYVIKIFLDVLYRRNKHIVIPEVLLELVPELEEKLCQDLQKIDSIANSGDSKRIIQYVTNDSLHNILFLRYIELQKTLFEVTRHSTDKFDDLNSFMQRINNPVFINRDVIGDLLPASSVIILGDYSWSSIFSCIFRYILYSKTKQLPFMNGINVDFSMASCSWYDAGEDSELIFNY